jgi:hypothetical protein
MQLQIQNFLRKLVCNLSIQLIFLKIPFNLSSFIISGNRKQPGAKGYLYVGMHSLHHLKNTHTKKMNNCTGNTLAGNEN